jgi:DHA1 family quinolone resistance protein-like MFS transporter
MADVNLHRDYVMAGLNKMFLAFFFIFIPLYLVSIGMSGLQIGVLVSMFAITALIGVFPTGVINDRYDIRYVLFLGFIMISVFSFGITLTSEFLILLVFFFIGGLGQNFTYRSLENIIFKEKEPRHEGKKFGKFKLYSISGGVIGLLSGSVLVYALSFVETFRIIGVFFLGMFFLTLWLKPTTITRTRLVQYEKDFLNTQNILLAVIIFLFTSHWGAEHTSYILFIKQAFGLDMIFSGLYVAIPMAALGIAAYFYGKKIDHRTDFKKLLLYGMVISGVFHILMVNPNVYASFFFRILHEVGDGIAAISMVFWISKRFKRTRIGGDAGLFFVVMMLGEFVGSIVYGPLGEAFGYGYPLIISGVISAFVCAPLFLLLKSRLK